jgi:hypothetical protein
MEILLRFERETLAPYTAPGNLISMNMYDNLVLPWSTPNPVTDFPKPSFVKCEYDREGVLSNGVSFFGGDDECSLKDMERELGTASMVTRWREAHPDLVGTDKDVVKVFINELREALPKDHQKFLRGTGTAILLFKKATT